MMLDLESFYSRDSELPLENEPGGKILRGTLRRSSDDSGWQIGSVDLDQYLAQYHDHELMLVVASLDAASQTENDRHVCSVCGFPLDELGECLRCQWYNVAQARHRRVELFQEIDRIVEQSWVEPRA
jgi:hypothetical protein